MAVPEITQTPPAPVRGEPRPEFTAKANALLSALSLLVHEINASSNWANLVYDEIESDRAEALASKDTAVSAKDTAVNAKNTAVTAKNDAVTAKNAAETALSSALGSTLLASDALRQAGDSVSLHKGDGTSDSVSVVATNSARALHTDALRQLGASIQLVKANGASEVIDSGALISQIPWNGVGSTIEAYMIKPAAYGGADSPRTITMNVHVPASWLRYQGVGGGVGGVTWKCLGWAKSSNHITYGIYDSGVTIWKRVV